MKWFILIAFVLIIASLASAMLAMIRPRPGRNMVRSLGIRVALSILLFALILIAHWLGWINSTGLPLMPR
ncbi:MAG: DUF2909 domain-containing protein [Burkholderiaceae bacterium]|nr:DUF2909 domain-containing protein [Burkholderiaceae bacterium]